MSGSAQTSNRVVAAALLGLGLFSTQVPVSHAAEDKSIQITDLNISTIANSGGTLSTNHLVMLKGTFTNTTKKTIDNIDLDLVSTPAIGTRGELAQLLADPKSAKGLIASDKSATLRNVRPGSTKSWQITFRGEDILGKTAYGVFAIGVKPNSAEGDVATVVTTPWFFNSDVRPTNVALVVPLTTLNNHLANGEVKDQKSDLAEAQRLASLIAVKPDSKISWLQDSGLRSWATHLSTGPESEIPIKLNAALDGLAVTSSFLPFGNSDLAALSGANQQLDLLDTANLTRSTSLTRPIVYLPTQGGANQKAISQLNEQGVRTMVSNDFLRGNPRETTSAVATSASNPVLVYDLATSDCLSGANESDADFFKSVTCATSEIGMMTAESPQSSRSIIVLAPTQWKISTERLDSLISALSNNNWMQLADLELISSSQPSQNYISLVDGYQTQLSSLTIRQANKLRDETEIFTSLFVNKELSAGFDTSRILGFSSLWNSTVDATNYLTENISLLDSYLSAVSIQASSRITTPAESSEIPITIVNKSDGAVSVSVDLTSKATSRFSAKPSELIQVESGQRVTVPVQVKLIGAGVIDVQAQLIAPNGERFGEIKNIQISSAAYSQFARTLVWGAFGLLVLLALSNFIKRRKDKRSINTPAS